MDAAVIQYALAGIFFGMIGGMGMGGGVILVPVLTLLMGVAQKTAQGLNLLAFLPMSVTALIKHLRAGLVDFRTGLLMASFGAAGAAAGAFFAMSVEAGLLKTVFAVFLIALGGMRITLLLTKRRRNGHR